MAHPTHDRSATGRLMIGLTGANGFIGSAVTRRLLRDGHRVRALSRTLNHVRNPVDGVEWMAGNLSSPGDCEAFIRDLDAVVHLAHTNAPLTSDQDLPSDATLNLVPTLNLIQAVRDGKRPVRIVYASSGGAVYGRCPAGPEHRFSETDPCLPTSSYGIQKLAAEHYLRMAAERGWCSVVTLRISNPYGILLPPERRQGLVGVAMHQVLSGRPVPVFGNPDNVRDYVHLDDVAWAVEAAIRLSCVHETLNIGSGTGYSVRDVLRMIGEATGLPVRTETVGATGGGALVERAVIDPTQAMRVLGWTPEIGFAEGLARMAQQMRQE